MSVPLSHTAAFGVLVGVWRATKASPSNGNSKFTPREEKEI